MPVKAFPMPTVERLAAEVRRHIHLTANQLAAFNREVDLTAALIPGHADGPRLECFDQKFRYDIRGAGRASGAAYRRLLGLNDIGERLDRTVGAKVHHRRRLFLTTDVFKLAHVVLYFLAADDLVEMQ